MLDTETTFEELSKVFKLSPKDFYSRPSIAKYYEQSRHFFWVWECKIGTKDESFNAHLNGAGVRDLHLSDNFNRKQSDVIDKRQLRRILNSYTSYLVGKMGNVVKMLNNIPKNENKK